jgi:hypothetical protein
MASVQSIQIKIIKYGFLKRVIERYECRRCAEEHDAHVASLSRVSNASASTNVVKQRQATTGRIGNNNLSPLSMSALEFIRNAMFDNGSFSAILQLTMSRYVLVLKGDPCFVILVLNNRPPENYGNEQYYSMCLRPNDNPDNIYESKFKFMNDDFPSPNDISLLDTFFQRYASPFLFNSTKYDGPFEVLVGVCCP